MTGRRTVSYIAACVLLAACPGPRPLAPLVPMPLAPVERDSAAAWARASLPRTPTLIRFRWRYEDEQVKYAGRGTARIAPPDSLRFDYAGPLGFGSGAAVVIGDSVLWADPEKNFRALVPAIRMLWAAFGMVRPPAAEAAVSGAQLADSASPRRRVVWRFAEAQDTLDYLAVDSAGRATALEAEWRRRGERVARSRAQLDADQGGRPRSARVDFLEGSEGARRARFELTIGTIDTAATFTPNIWRSRR